MHGRAIRFSKRDRRDDGRTGGGRPRRALTAAPFSPSSKSPPTIVMREGGRQAMSGRDVWTDESARSQQERGSPVMSLSLLLLCCAPIGLAFRPAGLRVPPTVSVHYSERISRRFPARLEPRAALFLYQIICYARPEARPHRDCWAGPTQQR